jgi:hypothetical protein
MPNVLTPAQFKQRTIFAKAESTYGTAATIAAADYIEARNISFTPLEVQTVDRAIVLPHRGAKAGLASIPNVQISFDVALAPSGTRGTAPKWGKLLLAAGFAETVVATTSVTYSLISSGDASLTMHYFDVQNKHVITGARASSLTFKLDKGIPMVSLTYLGLYTAPVVAALTDAMPTPDLTGWTVEQLVDSRFTSGSINPGSAVPVAFSACQINMGLDTSFNDFPGPYTGVDISDRAPTLDMTIIAPPLATLNPFTLVENATPITGTLVHGTGNGKIATMAFKGRLTSAGIEEVEKFKGYKLTGGLEPVLGAGNDEFSLVLT